ncbi:MAG TPA: TonB-dependent receptor, partial [Blastocatellia bacterium]
LELTGNFSKSGPNGGPDPLVVAYLQKFPYFQPNPALAAQGIIAQSSINPVAENYIKAGLVPSTPSGTLFQQGPTLDNNDEITERVDVVATEKDRISVTLHAIRDTQINPSTVGLGNPSGNGGTYNNEYGGNRYLGSVAYTKTLSADMVNEFRLTAQRNDIRQAYPGSELPTASALGVGITPDQPTGPPRIGFISDGFTLGFSPQGPTQLINNTYIWNDTLSWQHGNHGFKMGFNFTPFQNNTIYDFFVNGEFDFFGTSGGGSFSMNDRADFLMGLPDDLFQAPKAPSNIRTHNVAGFFQDEWKARKNLTLTLGLRYEYSSPKLDTEDRTFSLHIDQQSVVFPGAPEGLLFPGDPGAPRGVNFPDRTNFAPRFGFAWDPKGDGKMSIRGGGGIFYDILKGEDNLQFNGQIPFESSAFLTFNPLSGNPTGPVNYLSDPFGADGVPNPFPSKPPNHDINFADAGFLPIGGAGVFYVNPHLKTPYIYQYNLSVQRELWKDTTLEVSY